MDQLAEKLVKHFGGRKETAVAMGVSTEAIRLWLNNGIPLSTSIEVEKKSDGIVTAEEILQAAKQTQQQDAA